MLVLGKTEEQHKISWKIPLWVPDSKVWVLTTQIKLSSWLNIVSQANGSLVTHLSESGFCWVRMTHLPESGWLIPWLIYLGHQGTVFLTHFYESPWLSSTWEWVDWILFVVILATHACKCVQADIDIKVGIQDTIEGKGNVWKILTKVST